MFDIKPIEPLVQNEDEEDEKKGLMDEKPINEIGAFIKHEYFNDEE